MANLSYDPFHDIADPGFHKTSAQLRVAVEGKACIKLSAEYAVLLLDLSVEGSDLDAARHGLQSQLSRVEQELSTEILAAQMTRHAFGDVALDNLFEGLFVKEKKGKKLCKQETDYVVLTDYGDEPKSTATEKSDVKSKKKKKPATIVNPLLEYPASSGIEAWKRSDIVFSAVGPSKPPSDPMVSRHKPSRPLDIYDGLSGMPRDALLDGLFFPLELQEGQRCQASMRYQLRSSDLELIKALSNSMIGRVEGCLVHPPIFHVSSTTTRRVKSQLRRQAAADALKQVRDYCIGLEIDLDKMKIVAADDERPKDAMLPTQCDPFGKPKPTYIDLTDKSNDSEDEDGWLTHPPKVVLRQKLPIKFVITTEEDYADSEHEEDSDGGSNMSAK